MRSLFVTNETMTCAELVTAREFLGLPGSWLAETMNVDPRSERRWESGESDIPAAVRTLVTDLLQATALVIADIAEQTDQAGARGLVLLRTDEDYQTAVPAGIALPARWHRIAAARAFQLRPWLSLGYQGEPGPAGVYWLRPTIAVDNLDGRLGEILYTATEMSSLN